MKNKDIQIIFVDIDDTILNHTKRRHYFDMPSIRALKKAQKNGYQVIISTARPYDSVYRLNLFKKFVPNGIVCTNGAVAFYNDQIILNDYYPHDEAKNIIDICTKLGIVIEVSTERGRYFTLEKNSYVDEYFHVFHETLPIVKGYDDENVSALLLFAPIEFDEEIKRQTNNKYDYYRFAEHGVDLRRHFISKAQGVIKMLEYLKIDSNNALSIGDNDADIFMFEVTKYSCAMANGKDAVKAKASFVTKTCKRHGVKYALKHFNII